MEPRQIRMKMFSSLLVLFLFDLSAIPLRAQIASAFPLGGQRGTTFDVEMRGSDLDGAYAAWFDCDDLKAQVRDVRRVELESGEEVERDSKKKKQLAQKVSLTMEVKPAAPIGYHRVRLVSPRGLSNAFWLQVNSEPVVAEMEATHNTPRTAQSVSFPVVVNGTIGKPGEVDYYSFDAQRGQKLLVDVDSEYSGAEGFEPVLALLEPIEDWFNEATAKQLFLAERLLGRPREVARSRLTYAFSQSGRYLLAVGESLGKGRPDYSYQLTIVPVSDSISSVNQGKLTQATAHKDETGWQERGFARNLTSDRLKELGSRAVVVTKKDGSRELSPAEEKGPISLGGEGGDPSAGLTFQKEKEPNETPSEAQEITVPGIIEGAIGRPGDVDYFKFTAKPGAPLAFEVQNVGAQPPSFNPQLEILDADEKEVLTNVYKFRVSDSWARTLEPKTIYTFERGGESYLKIRDLSSRHGDSNFRYRILIRPQVPHIGEVEIKEDCINLVAGEAKKLTIIAGREEGFGGEIAVTVEDLPQGVQAFAAAEVESAGPPREAIHPERFLPKTQKVTVVLRAIEGAPPTPMPRLAKVKVWPIVEGKPGGPVSVSGIPLMVVQIAH